ncbi:hypothetical protein PUW81_009040 [Microbacterium sp. NM3R9]|uniref:hypothetical protein n=1 Tax=Microbacterium thalli TaxID=3027921 RepID=UPI002366C2E3|nr:hypothetical protein [Microbacterium thalli]MDD7929265.1 hypothetical protein [Microbacterium thalli]MDN8549251.1 hypothetical protein [Microbacterium thalli]
MDLSWLWLLPVAAGATMQVVSVFWFERLRPDVPYPLWTFATREPGGVRALRVGGATLIVFAAVMLALSRGALWFVTPIVVAAAFVPMVVAIYVVNGRFTRRQAPGAEATD